MDQMNREKKILNIKTQYITFYLKLNEDVSVG